MLELERKPQAAGCPAAAPSRVPVRHIPSRPVPAERESPSRPLAGDADVPNPSAESECRPRRPAARGAFRRARQTRPPGMRACEPP